ATPVASAPATTAPDSLADQPLTERDSVIAQLADDRPIVLPKFPLLEARYAEAYEPLETCIIMFAAWVERVRDARPRQASLIWVGLRSHELNSAIAPTAIRETVVSRVGIRKARPTADA